MFLDRSVLCLQWPCRPSTFLRVCSQYRNAMFFGASRNLPSTLRLSREKNCLPLHLRLLISSYCLPAQFFHFMENVLPSRDSNALVLITAGESHLKKQKRKRSCEPSIKTDIIRESIMSLPNLSSHNFSEFGKYYWWEIWNRKKCLPYRDKAYNLTDIKEDMKYPAAYSNKCMVNVWRHICMPISSPLQREHIDGAK